MSSERPHAAPPNHRHRRTSRSSQQRASAHRHDAGAPPLPEAGERYPFVYSKDPLDARRYSLFGGGAPSGRVSRGMAIFSTLVIVAVLGIGLLTLLLGVLGR